MKRVNYRKVLTTEPASSSSPPSSFDMCARAAIVAYKEVSIPLLRSSCDSCSRKKNKCSGETPCERCARTGVECRYSTKRKLGRPRTAVPSSRKGKGVGNNKGEAGGSLPNKRHRGSISSRREAGVLELEGRPSFCVSPATGLAGLAESRYLSCFVEHFNPL